MTGWAVDIVDSPIGPLAVAASAAGLVTVAFDGRLPEPMPAGEVTARSSAILDQGCTELDEFFSGRRTRFDVPLDFARATPFTAHVLRTLAETVRYGETTTYGELAEAVGKPRAPRAIGQAMGRNPLTVVVPCHRVLGAAGLGGFSRGDTQAGRDRKRELLALEGIVVRT